MKIQTFFGSVFILFVGSAVAKFLGAVYRIPLTWILGAEGLGLYQLVFPVFSLLLILSATGMPTAISQVIASHNNSTHSKQIFKISLLLMFFLGILGSLFLFLFSGIISNLQGNGLVVYSYIAIAPAVVFVSILSAFRGYFQGRLNMIPTALSNISEQLFKLIFGLTFSALLVKNGIQFGVMGAIIGVTLSELFTVLMMFIFYINERKKFKEPKTDFKISNKVLLKEIIKTAFPVVLASVIIPTSLVIDSFLVINLLNFIGFSTENSTILWGIHSGIVMSIINLPVVLCVCVATVFVPTLSGSKSILEKQTKIQKGFWTTMYIVFPCVIVLALLAPQILSFLYADSLVSDGVNEFEVATRLLLYSSPMVILIAILQTQTAILQGDKHLVIPVLNLFVAVIIKVIILLLAVLSFNIYGVVIANYCLYLSVVLLNWWQIKVKVLNSFKLKIYLPKLLAASVNFVLAVLVFKNFTINLSVYLSLPIIVLAGLLTYLISLMCLNVGKNKEFLKKLAQKSL